MPTPPRRSDEIQPDATGARPWRLWRMDDHGHTFLVAEHFTREAAWRQRDELAAKGHKQTYWVEPPGSPATS